MVIEEWKTIPSCPNYEASSTGQIRRVGSHSPLKPSLTCGYLNYGLSHYGKVTKHLGHALVAEAFHGRRPDGREVNHKDANRLNNAPLNLEYVTRLENVRHAHALGRYQTGKSHWTKRSPERIARGLRQGAHTHPETVRRGSLNGCAKITEDDVRMIRKMHSDGVKQVEIAKRFCIRQTQISNIVTGKQWRHVP